MPTDVPTALTILALALLWDGLAGEYPAVVHPVVWIGQAVAAGLRFAPGSGWWRQLLFGTVLTVLIVGCSAGTAWLCLWLVKGYVALEIVFGALLLKASFALKALRNAADSVARPLEAGNLAEARQALRALCSRDPTELGSEDLLAATIESLAENASDSFVAPLLFYVALGVPGAIGYRAINTLDAMIGYRGKFEALGKCAARLDDLANFLPARLTALLLLAAGWLCGGNAVQGWRILCRDGAKTPSPNGGRPMATMAGLLDVCLDKKGVYSLGDRRKHLTLQSLRCAWRIVLVAGVALAGVCGVAITVAGTFRLS